MLRRVLRLSFPPDKIMMNPCRRWRQLLGAITTLSVLALAGTAAGLLGWLFYSLDTPIGVKVVKDLLLHINGEHRFTVVSPVNGLPVIRGTLATSLQSYSLNLRSSSDISAHLVVSGIDLKISVEKEETIQIYTIQWHYNGIKHTLEDCFSFQGALWFASPSEFKEPWPLNNVNISKTPLPSSFGMHEMFWLSSTGVAITLPSQFPVRFSFNSTGSNNLCFQSHDDTRKLKLKYRIIVGPDIKHVHAYIVSFLPKPLGIPPVSLFAQPTWSVYSAQWKSLQLQTYTKLILTHRFNGSLLLFNHDYIQNYIRYGQSFSRDRKHEKDIVDMAINSEWVVMLKNELGYVKRRGLCPTVFISLTLKPEGLEMRPNIGVDIIQRTDGFHIRHSDKKRFHAMISAIREISICNAALETKVNADISSTLTFQQNPITRNLHLIHSLVNQTLDEFAHSLVTQTVASPWMHQFILMDDRIPDWNSLSFILSEAFSLGIAGYPFLMAPGLALQNTTASHQETLDAELYIRWMQLVALFPAVHINIPPWTFPQEVVNLAHDVLNIRYKYLPVILEVARSTVHSGLPIIRPMWMSEATTHPAVISINDQFSISHDVIVAPVLKKNARSRHVYLPSGDWLDTLHSKAFTGPLWINNYTVKLEQLPVFTRIQAQNDDDV